MTGFPENLCEALIEETWFIFAALMLWLPPLREKACRQHPSFLHPPIPFLKVWEIFFWWEKQSSVNCVKVLILSFFLLPLPVLGSPPHLCDVKSLTPNRQCDFWTDSVFPRGGLTSNNGLNLLFCPEFSSTHPCTLVPEPKPQARNKDAGSIGV